MTDSRFRTDNSVRKEKQDLAVYEEFCRLTAEPGVSKTKVSEYLCEKYGLSMVTIYTIRKRVAKRLSAQEVSL